MKKKMKEKEAKDSKKNAAKEKKEGTQNTAAAEDQVREKKENAPEGSETEVDRLESELQELKDKYLRLYAEFENYKKRTLREKIELMSSAAQDTMTALLPVLDDFDRAKKSADAEGSKEVFSEGVKLVYNKLYATLRQKGLKEMESDGQAFDPELHDAITEIPAPSEDLKGKIVDTIEKGYYLKDKIIRHAKVVVGM
jgi:molecular chaperone GrpE